MKRSSTHCGVCLDLVVLTVRQGRLSVLAERDAPGDLRLPSYALDGEVLDEIAAQLLQTAGGIADSQEALFLEQLKTYGTQALIDGGQLIRVGYVALVGDSAIHPPQGRVFAVDDLRETGVLQQHDDVLLEDAIERVRSKFEYTTIASTLVTEPFTIPELRRVYESVWSVTLHPANFRRKVLATPAFVVPDGSAIAGRKSPDLFRRGEAALLHPAMLRPSDEP